MSKLNKNAPTAAISYKPQALPSGLPHLNHGVHLRALAHLQTVLIAGLLAVLIAGCPVSDGGNGGDGQGTSAQDGNRDESVTSPIGKTSGEPNDSFSEPIVAVFDDAGVARLQGTVASQGDIDVFLLGALDPGDRVIVVVSTSGLSGNLDATLALFDDDGKLVFDNDDQETASGLEIDSFIDWTARHSGDAYKLVVSHSAFPLNDGFTGAYIVDVTVERGGDAPAPATQIVLLNFDGGDVNVDGVGPLVLAPFDASDISPLYIGESDTLKTTIQNVFVEKYARFDMVVLTSDDPPPSSGTEFTIVHFGGFNDGAYGIADDVDLLDLDRCDDAIIFTESFFPEQFQQLPTAQELGVAIGNVAAHECGHLLGLNHVNDDTDLMDAVSPADVLLNVQDFKDSPLSEQIVPIGTQDSVLLLLESIGPVPEP